MKKIILVSLSCVYLNTAAFAGGLSPSLVETQVQDITTAPVGSIGTPVIAGAALLALLAASALAEEDTDSPTTGTN